jgi:3-phenylpropionate/cinnamic acid dioxygenase small subunit
MIDDLYAAYTSIVDGRRWDQWPDLFTEECAYAVYSLDNVERGLPLAYMLDDCRARLLDRIKFITEVWAGTVEPYRTRHVTQHTQTKALDEDTYDVQANVLVTYTDMDGVPGILASGYYEDRIRMAGDRAFFADKKVYLDGMPGRYLIYPL